MRFESPLPSFGNEQVIPKNHLLPYSSETPPLSQLTFSQKPIISSPWPPNDHQYLIGLRQILTGQMLDTDRFRFTRADGPIEYSSSAGLISIIDKALKIVEEQGSQVIAHHAHHLVDATCNLLFKGSIGEKLTECLCENPTLSLESPLEDILTVIDAGSFPSQTIEESNSFTQAVETLIQASRFQNTPDRVLVAKALGRLKVEIERIKEDPAAQQLLSSESQESLRIIDQRLALYPSPLKFIIQIDADSIIRQNENQTEVEQLHAALTMISKFTQTLLFEAELLDKSRWIRETSSVEGDKVNSQSALVSAHSGEEALSLQSENHAPAWQYYRPKISLLEISIEPDSASTFQNIFAESSEARLRQNNIMINLDLDDLSSSNPLLIENPCFFVHRRATENPATRRLDLTDPARYNTPPKGYSFYFHSPSKEAFYIRDTSLRAEGEPSLSLHSPLIDLFNPYARARITDRALNLLSIANSPGSPFPIKAICINSITPWLTDTYQNELRGTGYPNYQPKPSKEFLAEFVAAIKERFPEVAFVTFETRNPAQAWSLGFDAVVASAAAAGEHPSIEAEGYNFVSQDIITEPCCQCSQITPLSPFEYDFNQRIEKLNLKFTPTPYSAL